MAAGSSRWIVAACVCAAIVAAEGWRRARRARAAADAARNALAEWWPAGQAPRPGARERLEWMIGLMRRGRFADVLRAGELPQPLSKDEQESAKRFWLREPELARRFVAAAEAAQRLQTGGADVTSLRRALARALAAAARKQRGPAEREIRAAETLLDAVEMGGGESAESEDAVRGAWARIQPAFDMARDLMTEGYEVVALLAGRARWRAERKEFGKAAALLRMAGKVLGAEPAASAGGRDFLGEDGPPAVEPAPADKASAERIVRLCEATAAAKSASPIVKSLVGRARREFDAARFGEAAWWGKTALKAMGIAAP